MTEWEKIVFWLLNDDEGKCVHKLIWDGFAYLSFPGRRRFKIDETWTLEKVKELINKYQ